jgi:hypothetical protein
MTPSDAVLAVLRDALRAGHLDPFETPDVRGAVLTAVRELVADGRAVKTATGVYALAG